MAEYIDREAFKKEYLCFGYLPEMSETEFDAFPSADVAPVRHAKWEVVVGSDGKEKMVCTGCRKQQELTGVFSHCPDCGARMDGEEGERE